MGEHSGLILKAHSGGLRMTSAYPCELLEDTVMDVVGDSHPSFLNLEHVGARERKISFRSFTVYSFVGTIIPPLS